MDAMGDKSETEDELRTTGLVLSVIVPARNEADVLGGCLESLLAQSEPGFALGVEWELIVVDDASTDGTRAIAEAAAEKYGTGAAGAAGVRVVMAPVLDVSVQSGFTGKTNACWAGAQEAEGALLLFTDADTEHALGSLSRARRELEKYEVAMLSYSPRQLTAGAVQRLAMPLIFAELAIAYPMQRVNAAGDRTAAANGQYLMVTAEDYFAVGGHRAVGREVLEDVALANLFKRSKGGIRFRYAPDAVSARMYRTTTAMMEGWTKNLALLFASPLGMAALRGLDLLLIVGIPVLALVYPFLTQLQRALLLVLWVRIVWRFYARVAKSNFGFADCALSVAGLPLFIVMLVKSYADVKVKKAVAWKGRVYRTGR